MPTQEWIISGKVQGVFYRASVREMAESLGLTGWVKNRPDGSVQLRATGPAQALAQLERWCAQGPPRAQVEKIERKDLPEEAFPHFSVIR